MQPNRSPREPWPTLAVVALVVSLAVNVFIASAVAMRWFAPGAATTARDGGDRPMARLIARLPQADARVVRDVQREQRVSIAAARADYDRALAAATQAAAREPLDAAAVERALDDVRRKRHALTDLRVQIYAKAIPRLSPEGRRVVTSSE